MNIEPSITTDELGVKGINKNEEQPFKHVMKGAFDYKDPLSSYKETYLVT